MAVAPRVLEATLENLEEGVGLIDKDLRAIAWPSDAVPEGAFTDPQELVGRGLIQPISQNETVLPARLAPVGAGAGLPPVIPEGMRAVSVRVNDVIGVASTKDISPGGLYMNTQANIPEGAFLMVRIPLDKDVHVVCKAEVIYSNPGQGVGLRFHDITDEARATLERAVSKQE